MKSKKKITDAPERLPSATGSVDCVVLQLKLPVPVKELAAIVNAMETIHDKKSLYMRQVGPMLEIFKPGSPPNEKLSDRDEH